MKSISEAAKLVRGYGDSEDPLALEIFSQQAMALGRLFTIASNFIDPSAYFVGGGVVEASPRFREWFLARVREHTSLRQEQLEVAPVRAHSRSGHGGCPRGCAGGVRLARRALIDNGSGGPPGSASMGLSALSLGTRSAYLG